MSRTVVSTVIPGLSDTQATLLLRLVEVSLDFPGEVVPTRHKVIESMGILRALERRNLVAWRLLPHGTGQGVQVTQEGRELAELRFTDSDAA
jgi:hypothetical protein